MKKTLFSLLCVGLTLLHAPVQAQTTGQEKLYIETALNSFQKQGYTFDELKSEDKWLMLDKGKGYCSYLKSNYPYKALIGQIKVDTAPNLYLRGTAEDKIKWSNTTRDYYETLLYSSTVALCPDQNHKAEEYYQSLEQGN